VIGHPECWDNPSSILPSAPKYENMIDWRGLGLTNTFDFENVVDPPPPYLLFYYFIIDQFLFSDFDIIKKKNTKKKKKLTLACDNNLQWWQLSQLSIFISKNKNKSNLKSSLFVWERDYERQKINSSKRKNQFQAISLLSLSSISHFMRSSITRSITMRYILSIHIILYNCQSLLQKERRRWW